MGVLHGFFAVVGVVFDVFSSGGIVGVGDEAESCWAVEVLD